MLLDRNIFYYVNIHNWIGQQALFHTDKIYEVKHHIDFIIHSNIIIIIYI